MKLPKFITFTGADDNTDVAAMEDLSEQYPVEFGILLSTKRQGSSRYPSMDWIADRLANNQVCLMLSAHVCGAESRSILEHGKSYYDATIFNHFSRAQVNTSEPNIDLDRVREWAQGLAVIPILQSRDPFTFPSSEYFKYLFDISGGEGKSPKTWPVPVNNHLHGYAGGLNKSNVFDAVQKIGSMANNYWIDMETGVRDENDQFSIDLCRQVCEAVYGKGRIQEAA